MQKKLVCALICCAWTLPSWASDTSVGLFNFKVIGLEPSMADTVMDALATQLGELNIGRIMTTRELNAMLGAQQRADVLGCNETTCLAEIGAAAGVEQLLTGSLSLVDQALVVSLQRIDVRASQVLGRVTLSWHAPPSEFSQLLHAAAEKLFLSDMQRPPGEIQIKGLPTGARWFVGQAKIKDNPTKVDVGVYLVRIEAMGFEPFTQEVLVHSGQTTVVEGKLKELGWGKIWGPGLQAGVFEPLVKTYVAKRPGLAIDAFYWWEFGSFAFMPRFGVRADLASDPKANYLDLAMDFGAHWLPFRTSIAPFVGLGFGARWLQTKHQETVRLGYVITTTHIKNVKKDGFGFGGYSDVGLLFFRRSSVRLILRASYEPGYVPAMGFIHGVQASMGLVI